MANSKITIEFSTVPEVNQKLIFSESALGLTLNEVFKQNRYGNYQVKIPDLVSVGTPEEPETQYLGFTSANYKNAFNVDYNGTNLFTVSSSNGVPGDGLGTVVIIANYVNAEFALIENTSNARIVIENEDVNEFYIDSIEFIAAPDKCNDATAIITTNRLGTTVNPIYITHPRGQSFLFEAEASDNQSISQTITMPPLMPSSFVSQVSNSPFGATVTLVIESVNGLNYQYAIGAGAFQESNVFSGILEGNYLAKVKDQFGCVKVSGFVVDELSIGNSPYFYISKANSFRFANRITWGDSGNYKNDENTLSCEVDVDIAYKEVQQFQSADIITTQFKSNYRTNTASIVRDDQADLAIPIIQKSQNIGIKDKRDAIRYNLGNGQNAIYFLSGNTYNYQTNAVEGAYTLNGALPEWAQIGNYFEAGGFYSLIENIIFDESKNADVIVFSNNYAGVDFGLVVSSIYNRFNYEVYEFSVDMVSFIDQKFKVKIVNSDLNFTTLNHISEVIWCKVKHANTLEIRYRNQTNTDIDYSTGIEHKLRAPILKAGGKVDEQSEIYKTDTDAILLSADLYEADEFQFEPVTKEIWRKIMIALSHEKVFLNGIGYVKNGAFTSEGPLERSNLYLLTANMIKTGNVYNSQTSGNMDFNGSEVEVPGLISTDSGYLRY